MQASDKIAISQSTAMSAAPRGLDFAGESIMD
jgi:hypothetical protein